MKIFPINVNQNTQIVNKTKYERRNNLTFGHYLDDEKRNKEYRLSSLNSDISSVNSRIWSENYDFERESSSIDSDIYKAENELDEIETRIYKLRNRADSKEYYVDSLLSESRSLEQKAKKNLDIIQQLENEKETTVAQLKESNTNLQNKLAEEFKSKSNEIEANFKSKSNEMHSGIKNSLITMIVNPLIEACEGNDIKLPSSIYIENISSEPVHTDTQQGNIDELFSSEKAIFSWLVKQTDSNYAKIDVSGSDKDSIFSLLRKISVLASRCFEETGKRTFTLLEGFENFDSTFTNGTALKELFLNTEELYHNIIVVISRIPYSKISDKVNFADVMKVEKSFLSDKKLGKDSFVKFVSQHKYTGENLLTKIIKG